MLHITVLNEMLTSAGIKVAKIAMKRRVFTATTQYSSFKSTKQTAAKKQVAYNQLLVSNTRRCKPTL